MRSRCARFTTVVVWLGILVPVCPVRAAAPSDPVFAEGTAAYLRKLEALGFSGVVLVARGDQVLLDSGYGLANRETGAEWSSRTVATVGSITKQFTAAALLTLEERGELSTNDPISKYFEAVPPDKEEITLHHLLTHSSGIVDQGTYDDFDPVTREDIVRLSLTSPLAFEPGTEYEYSNAGYSLLGAIIEQLTDMSYETYLRETLFLPAGMRETGYIIPDWDEDRLAVGYRNGESWGTLIEKPMAADGPYWILRGNGGIHSTAKDMLYWAEALLEHRVLDPESRKKLWTGYVDEGGGVSFYGYGWVLMDGSDGEPVIMHNGGNTIFFADLVILPEKQAVIFLQTNVAWEMPGAEELGMQLVENWLVGKPYPEVPDVHPLQDSELDGFVGEYSLESGGAITVATDRGALVLGTSDREAFTCLTSSVEPDTGLASERNVVIEGVMTGILANDYQPLFEAYEGRVPLDRLQTGGEERRLQAAAKFGPMTGFTVLGTTFSEEGAVTAVEVKHERGSVYRQYVWEEDDTLLGYRPRMTLPAMRFFPVSELAFRSWDSRALASSEVRFVTRNDGGLNLVLGGVETRLEARRARGDRD